MTRCYLCGCEDFAVRPGKVRDKADLQVLQCANCGLVRLSSFDHIKADFYAASGMHEDAPCDIDSWFRESQPDDARRFDRLREELRGRSLLDFGCGPGGFLLLARDTVTASAGIEPERRLADFHQAQGLRTYASLQAMTPTEKFDIITMFHVLEHLRDPLPVLRDIARHLAPGGRLIVEVPNADDALLTLYGCQAFSEFTYWSCHLFLYNRATLTELLRQAGYRPEKVEQVQRFPLSNHLHWLAKGRPGGHRDWAFLDSPELTRAYAASLARQEGCDTLLGFFHADQGAGT